MVPQTSDKVVRVSGLVFVRCESFDRIATRSVRIEQTEQTIRTDDLTGIIKTYSLSGEQGSILSPMLANIFLHYVLDTWFEATVKSHVRGFCAMVRYADDFICVVRYVEDARRIERALRNRFHEIRTGASPDQESEHQLRTVRAAKCEASGTPRQYVGLSRHHALQRCVSEGQLQGWPQDQPQEIRPRNARR